MATRQKTEDLILHDSHVYPAVANTIDSLVSNYDADILSVDLDLPIRSEDQVVELYEQV